MTLFTLQIAKKWQRVSFSCSHSLLRLKKELLYDDTKLFNVPATFIVRLCPSATQLMFLLSFLDTSIMDKVEKKPCVRDWNLTPVNKLLKKENRN